MTKINLLPWRKDIRDENNIKFGMMVGAAVAVCLCLVASVYLYEDHLIDIERANSDFIKNEVKGFDAKIGILKDLQDQKNKLITHLQIIQSLQKDRGSVVKILDGIIHTIPDGVYLTKMERNPDDRIHLEGITDTNSYVSNFIENLKTVTAFKSVDLGEIKSENLTDDSTHTGGAAKKTFQISISLAGDRDK